MAALTADIAMGEAGKEGLPLVERLIDTGSYPVANVLDLLLQDKSTKKNIIWATDTYEEYGEGFADKAQMNAGALLRRADIIRPRILKSQEAQAERTRKKAEVFTPAWLCNKMNNCLDEDWFGRGDVFNAESGDHAWTATEGKVKFPEGKKWQHYVDSRRLEITCGEAPYLVSRYDVTTGEMIVPPGRRIGILDRKLRIVNENTSAYDEWLKWAVRAFEATYGYECQGDNVLIARINLLLTFTDYYEERWGRQPDDGLLQQMANKIAWNIWQMDGMRDAVPLGKPYEEFHQMTLFDGPGDAPDGKEEPAAVPCMIYDWRGKNSLRFMDIKEMQVMGKKLLNYVIGNPPYQEDVKNEGDRANPVYDKFMEAAYQIADVVELIHPARFLFNAGQTPKSWNKKMLEDEHLKVLQYEPDAGKAFPNTDIKGGVAITIHDTNKKYGSIGTFTSFPELNNIVQKISECIGTSPRLDSIVASQGLFRFSEDFFEEHPEVSNYIGAGTGNKIVSSIMNKLPDVFLDTPHQNGEYIRFLGRIKNQRVYKYIERRYLVENSFIDKYKAFIPEANNSGHYGETLTMAEIGFSNEGCSDTFLCVGPFDSEDEPKNFQRYMRSKFFRSLLGIKKVTQHCPPTVWQMIPLQDFTENSDIDWSKSVHEIDLQLYRKYGLDEGEIEFIESHVKEME